MRLSAAVSPSALACQPGKMHPVAGSDMLRWAAQGTARKNMGHCVVHALLSHAEPSPTPRKRKRTHDAQRHMFVRQSTKLVISSYPLCEKMSRASRCLNSATYGVRVLITLSAQRGKNTGTTLLHWSADRGYMPRPSPLKGKHAHAHTRGRPAPALPVRGCLRPAEAGPLGGV